MTLEVIEGNLLDIDQGIICHQVNCQGVMGSGIAAQIRDKWPKVYDEYRQHCGFQSNKYCLLGSVTETRIAPGFAVANVFGQYDYGTDSRKTNYGAVARGFNDLMIHYDLQIYVPYLMGCGLAGGDWEIYQEIIEFYIPKVIVVRLPE